MNSEFRFEPAAADDIESIRVLLETGGLPVADIDRTLLGGFVVARQPEAGAGEVVGVCGIEVRGEDGLLRSLAVEPSARGRSLGKRLVADRVAWSCRAGLRALYLLTIDADAFFTRLGFTRIERADLPAEIIESSEFRTLCPVTAIAMTRSLAGSR